MHRGGKHPQQQVECVQDSGNQDADHDVTGHAAQPVGDHGEQNRAETDRHDPDIGNDVAHGFKQFERRQQALEALPWRFFWDSVSYEVEDYPRSLVRLRLHTLSLSEDWIGV